MPSSAFVVCKVRHKVSLSPCHALEPKAGLEQELNTLLMRYNESVNGVILSFSNVQLVQPYGHIINDMPYFHTTVQADLLVFRPVKGMVLTGLVNKIGSNHVGVLFAGAFNGSVAASELPDGFVHNYAQDCWLGENGESISVDDEIQVKVLKVHTAGGMISIEATLRLAPSSSLPKKPAAAVMKTAKPSKVTPIKPTKTTTTSTKPQPQSNASSTTKKRKASSSVDKQEPEKEEEVSSQPKPKAKATKAKAATKTKTTKAKEEQSAVVNHEAAKKKTAKKSTKKAATTTASVSEKKSKKKAKVSA